MFCIFILTSFELYVEDNIPKNTRQYICSVFCKDDKHLEQYNIESESTKYHIVDFTEEEISDEASAVSGLSVSTVKSLSESAKIRYV